MTEEKDIIEQPALNKEEIESELNTLWDACKYDDFEKFCVYKKRVDSLNELGVITLRTREGKHTVIIGK